MRTLRSVYSIDAEGIHPGNPSALVTSMGWKEMHYIYKASPSCLGASLSRADLYVHGTARIQAAESTHRQRYLSALSFSSLFFYRVSFKRLRKAQVRFYGVYQNRPRIVGHVGYCWRAMVLLGCLVPPTMKQGQGLPVSTEPRYHSAMSLCF
ncbi:hypothetical protein BS47DRAFT_670221 [Hydnum rufescens UP504]|uniref:Uncharacterized protein n=1 Tax=Hydnum rufescens UP504 TaxID=1448309 RepID=A0A9P6DND0_9AGAM|nr:hypothetical protein BS47DRAFT_670221 [Hydnum rufescens UP504]